MKFKIECTLQDPRATCRHSNTGNYNDMKKKKIKHWNRLSKEVIKISFWIFSLSNNLTKSSEALSERLDQMMFRIFFQIKFLYNSMKRSDERSGHWWISEEIRKLSVILFSMWSMIPISNAKLLSSLSWRMLKEWSIIKEWPQREVIHKELVSPSFLL